MYFLQTTQGINWNSILLGSEDWGFLLETVLRTGIMFLILLTGLSILGKRGVKQLSVFELVVIIGLGSAAGDPMFYKDVGILPGLVVFIIIIALYSIVTYIVGKSKNFERLVEGRPMCLIKDGHFMIDNFRKEALGEDEFFAELRMMSVSHLGQVEEAIIEVSGEISIFYYDDHDVKFGLPIMPDSLDDKTVSIKTEGYYSCSFCGYTASLKAVETFICPICQKNQWVKSSNKKRIA